jgi:aminoglycoside phosphotransferase (APT) family kinase protein
VSAPTTDEIRHALAAHLPHPGQPLRVTPIPTGKFNDSFFIAGDGVDWVIRIAPPQDAVFLFYERNMMAQEPGLHRLLRASTDIPVAEVVAYDTSHAILDRDFLVLERLPGQPVSQASGMDYASVLRQTGRYLSQAHSLTDGQYGYLGEHRCMEPQTTWQDAFCVMWHKLLDDVVATGHYSAEDEARARRVLDDRVALFDRDVPSSLLHMDIWAQNILVDEGSTVTGLVDWDRALWGDPEIEFAVLDYCGISEPPFWEGYGQPRDVSREAQIRNVVYLLYELQKYIVIRHGRSHDPAGARRYRDQSLQLMERAGF